MPSSRISEPNRGQPDPQGGESDYLRVQLNTLAGLATDLAGQFELQPLLERILRHAVGLLGCESGSICLVDEVARVYRKEVDLGVECHSGMTFPLDEGVTGEIMRAHGPVMLDEYSKVIGGHIKSPERLSLHAVIGVPIRWRGSTIGSCVVFSRTPGRTFGRADADLLELFAKHAAIAIMNSRLHAEAQERTKQAATAAERERIVRDVHDTVGRGLAAVLLHLEAAEREAAPTLEHGVAQSLGLAREAAHEALAETRRTVLGLGSALLDGRSLAEAIGLELAWTESAASLSGQFVVLGEPRQLVADVAYALFTMVQEALTNVISHARARTVRVGLVYARDTVSVLVEDDGRGFDSSTVALTGDAMVGMPGKFGLQGLVARAQRLDGTVTVDSTLGWGTKVRVDVAYVSRRPEGTPRPRWRVLLVHERPIVRAGLVRLLALAEPDIQVVGEVPNAAGAVEAYRLLRPDVVLADIRIPGTGGGGLVADLRAEDPDAAVVFLIDSPTDAATYDAAQQGARGFIARDIDANGLVRVVIAAARGEVLMPVDALANFTSRPTDHDAVRLTEREREIRVLLVQGLPNKAIAARLHISVKTVERHVGSLLKKSGAQNRTMLTGTFLANPD